MGFNCKKTSNPLPTYKREIKNTRHFITRTKPRSIMNFLARFIEKMIRRINFGKPIPGERANYVQGDYTPKLRKWEQEKPDKKRYL